MSEPASDDGRSLSERFWASPVTWLITITNVAVFLLAEHWGDTTSPATLIHFGASERRHIWAGEYWRFVTPMFLHIGWIHMLWNAYGMFGWCAPVERALGMWRFALAYLLSGIGATAVSVLCHDVVAAGASGAGFGMIGALLALLRGRSAGWGPFFSNPAVKNILVTIVIWTGLGLTAVPMDNYAHLGGLFFGFALGFLLDRPARRHPVVQIATATAFAVFFVAILVAAALPWGRA